MSDTPGSSPTGSMLEELRASIRTSFADWQYLADELSKVTDADLRSPHVSTTPEEQEYFVYLCRVVDYALGSSREAQDQLNHDLLAEQAVVADLRAQVETHSQLSSLLRSQLDRVTIAQPLGGASRRQTSRNPDPFKAEKSAALSRQNEYLAWKQGLQLCWKIDPLVFDTEEKKICHMASLIEGRARQERREDIDDILGDRSPYESASQFLKKLDTLYVTIDTEREAAIQFDKLKMDRQPFSTFYTTFDHLGRQCRYGTRNLVLALKLKVSDELKILMRADPTRAALMISMNCRESDHYLGPVHRDLKQSAYTQNSQDLRQHTHNQPNQPRPVNPQMPLQTNNDPMELDAMRYPNRDRNREEERRLGLCHYCKKPGHSVWDCESKKQADAQRQTRGQTAGRYNSSYNNRNNKQEPFPPSNRRDFSANYGNRYGARSIPRPYQQLNTFHGYVESDSLAPSESASNINTQNNSASSQGHSSSYEISGNATPPQ
ncbi:hypothetical protein H4I96_08373 [Botrytis cinerea]